MKAEQDFYHTSIAVGNKIVAYTAVSSFNTLGIDLSDAVDFTWTLQIFRSASDGTPTVTLQCSNDNTNWDNYQLESTSISLPVIFKKSSFEPKYLRVVYTATGSPTGTITMKFCR